MNTEELEKIGKEYVRLSNEHALDSIFNTLFDPNITYTVEILHASTEQDNKKSIKFTKSFNGIAQVSQMMHEFFASFKHVKWTIDHCKGTLSVDSVDFVGNAEIGFTRHWLGAVDDRPMQQSGVEWLHVTSSGKIGHILVQRVE